MSTAGVPLEELRFRLRGELYGPGDPGYSQACAQLDADGPGPAASGRPRLVARCCAAEDVVAALAFAGRQGLRAAVHGGGHAPADPSDDSLAIDLGAICDVEVDSQQRVVRVGGGASAAAIERATRQHGLATAPWREGRPCEDLIAAQVVSADGAILRASADANAGMLRLLCEGKTDSSVVTSLALRLHRYSDGPNRAAFEPRAMERSLLLSGPCASRSARPGGVQDGGDGGPS
jgi:FAD/FMN-containing dehydrogenase